MKLSILFLLLTLIGSITAHLFDDWTPAVEARKGKLKVAAYQAQLVGGTLLIQVTHEPGWHTSRSTIWSVRKRKRGSRHLALKRTHKSQSVAD